MGFPPWPPAPQSVRVARWALGCRGAGPGAFGAEAGACRLLLGLVPIARRLGNLAGRNTQLSHGLIVFILLELVAGPPRAPMRVPRREKTAFLPVSAWGGRGVILVGRGRGWQGAGARPTPLAPPQAHQDLFSLVLLLTSFFRSRQPNILFDNVLSSVRAEPRRDGRPRRPRHRAGAFRLCQLWIGPEASTGAGAGSSRRP